ncbi:sugar-binding transcriptional regulator [Pelagibacterium montanilacus]|uniref:sugar-binding transcriptional regulator n=1 Tax=Pelagibacterium montanilacus TaxID=2185280 RepID=UPI000F8F788B|nr:sugar-binding transcriptional regulator [Pelagibacterium montanilacus]
MVAKAEAARRREGTRSRLDDAARAGWLYYVAGNTQDEIASKLGVSRQSAQRLVSLAVSEKLVKVRLDHPIAHCMDLAARLRETFALERVEVVPTDPGHPDPALGIAEATAVEIETVLSATEPVTMGIGTGRTLKAAVDLMSPMDCPHHSAVSLAGNIAPDGSAAFYNVIFSIADKAKTRSFPMPLPVIAASAGERALLHEQASIRKTMALVASASISFVGIGDLGPSAPLKEDGFVTAEELVALQGAGAVGEMLGWTYDARGRFIEGLTNDRVASSPLPSREHGLVIAVARGANKLAAIRPAVTHRLVNGLITDEATAAALLG